MYIEPAEVTFRRNFNRILEKWKKSGHTYTEFQRLAGISATALRYYRSGDRTPSLECVTKMAVAFGIRTDHFFRL